MATRAWQSLIALLRTRAHARRASEEGITLTLEELLALRAQAVQFRLAPQRPSGSPLAGGYRSLFRGRGMDFDEVREYQPGDDIRTIDWLVSARTGRTHTKVFREERERSLYLLVDLRPAMRFASRTAFKSVVAARVAALMAWAAADSGDRVGGLIVDARRLLEVRPASGRRGVLRLLRALVEVHQSEPADAAHAAVDLATALRRLRRMVRPGGMVFALSDFRDLDAAALPQLAELARAGDLLGSFVYDPLEVDLPARGRFRISDGERVLAFDAEDPRWRERHALAFAERNRSIVRAFVGLRAHLLRLSTGNTLDESVRQLLRVREGTRRSLLRGRG